MEELKAAICEVIEAKPLIDTAISVALLVATGMLAFNSIRGLRLATEASAIKKAEIQREKLNHHHGFREFLIGLWSLKKQILASNLDRYKGVFIVINISHSNINFEYLYANDVADLSNPFSLDSAMQFDKEKAEIWREIFVTNHKKLSQFPEYERVQNFGLLTPEGGQPGLPPIVALISLIDGAARNYNRTFNIYPEDVGGTFTLDQWAKEYLVDERDHVRLNGQATTLLRRIRCRLKRYASSCARRLQRKHS